MIDLHTHSTASDGSLSPRELARAGKAVGLDVMALTDQMKKEYPEEYKRLTEKTGLTEKEVENWNQVQKKIYLPRKEGTDLLEQFEGYFDLKDVVIDKYDENDWPIRPEALKKYPTRETQILKQPDVVLLLHLLGEEFDQKVIKANYDYYEKRTLHGSSLSPSIYSVMGLKVGDDSKAYRYLRRAAFIDLLNLQKNTREGIHAANAGGVWQTVVFGFAGVSIDPEGVLNICPHMPKEWEGLSFRLHYYGSWVEITIDPANQVSVKRLSGEPAKIRIKGITEEI